MTLSDLTKIDLSIKMVTDQMISSLFRYETNIEYRRYLQIVKAPGRTVVNSARNTKNQYLANLYNDHSKQHIYDNGTRKETLENGFSIVYFKNGDIKQVFYLTFRPFPTRLSSITSKKKLLTKLHFQTKLMYIRIYLDLSVLEQPSRVALP